MYFYVAEMDYITFKKELFSEFHCRMEIIINF